MIVVERKTLLDQVPDTHGRRVRQSALLSLCLLVVGCAISLTFSGDSKQSNLNRCYEEAGNHRTFRSRFRIPCCTIKQNALYFIHPAENV